MNPINIPKALVSTLTIKFFIKTPSSIQVLKNIKFPFNKTRESIHQANILKPNQKLQVEFY